MTDPSTGARLPPPCMHPLSCYHPRKVRRIECKNQTSHHPVWTQRKNVSAVIGRLIQISRDYLSTGKKGCRTQAVSGAVFNKNVPFLCLGSCQKVLQRLTNRQMREVQHRMYSREAGLMLSTTHTYPFLVRSPIPSADVGRNMCCSESV